MFFLDFWMLYLLLVFICCDEIVMCRFEYQKMTWRKKEELSWKSIGEAEMPQGGCRMLIGLCWWKVQRYLKSIHSAISHVKIRWFCIGGNIEVIFGNYMGWCINCLIDCSMLKGYQLDSRKWFGPFLRRPWGIFTRNGTIYAIWLSLQLEIFLTHRFFLLLIFFLCYSCVVWLVVSTNFFLPCTISECSWVDKGSFWPENSSTWSSTYSNIPGSITWWPTVFLFCWIWSCWGK